MTSPRALIWLLGLLLLHAGCSVVPSTPTQVVIAFPRDDSSTYFAPDGRPWDVHPQTGRQGTTQNWVFVSGGSPLKPWTERLGFTVTEVWVPRAELERRTETARTVDPEMTYTVEEIGVDDIVLVTSMPKFKEHGVMRFSRHGSGSVAISYTQRVDAPGQLTYWTKLLKTAKIVPPASRR